MAFQSGLFVNQIFKQGTEALHGRSINIESGVINGVLQFSEWIYLKLLSLCKYRCMKCQCGNGNNMHLSGDINNLNVDY